jgi:phage/plasmid primase-like uncharacterized protein
MMMDIFPSIRERVPLASVLAMYGVRFNAAGFALCPIHGEKTASFRVHNDRWHCFGCNQSGDAVKLVSLMDKLSPLEAARKLDHLFSLELFPDRPLTPEERRQTAEAARQREADRAAAGRFREWLSAAWKTAIWYQRALRAERDKPVLPGDFHAAERAAIVSAELSKTEYLLDQLLTDGAKKQIAFYTGWKEEVARLESSRVGQGAAGTDAAG